MIAATAIANEVALYPCSPFDSEGFDGLSVVAVDISKSPCDLWPKDALRCARK